MPDIPLSARLRYKFDNTMSRGAIALIAWLALLSVFLIALAAIILNLSGLSPDGARVGFLEAAWLSLMRTLDAGTMGGDVGWGFRLLMLAVTLGGIFIISTLIGVLTSGIESKLDDLRKGRSFVVEKNHTIILGWSPQIFSIIGELVIANRNQKNACVVVLAEKDKVEMEDEIRDKVGDTGRTRIVCRTGSPLDLVDLEIANPQAARSIIIPSPPADDPDTEVIKSILAITNNPNRRKEPYNIVAEIRDRHNLEVAKLVGKQEAELVLADDLIAHITVQAGLQAGLSMVYTELLDFGGDEIYFHSEPALVGKTFGEALLAYEDSAVIGLRLPDGSTRVNPPMDTRIDPGTKVIAVSEDDDTVRLSGLTNLGIETGRINPPDHVTKISSRILVLGWNRRGCFILREMDNYVFSGSHATLVSDHSEAEIRAACDSDNFKNLKVEIRQGHPNDRTTIEDLNVQRFQYILILSDSDRLDPQKADAKTLITLLHLRDLADHTQASFTVTTEMLDVRNRDLAAVTRADDFIVSNKLVSLMLSQISENRALAAVFADFFDEDGSELYLKPVGDYVRPGTPFNFYTLVEAARRRGETAIGYRLKAEVNDAARMYGVHVNPAKSEKVNFGWDDKLIVLAED